MSRSDYTDDLDRPFPHRHLGPLTRAIRGKRGQKALKELATALDSMPDKSLVKDALVTGNGEFCALGVLGSSRGIDMSTIPPEDCKTVASTLKLAPILVSEIEFQNDEAIIDYEWLVSDTFGLVHSPIPDKVINHKRWLHMCKWVNSQIIKKL